jgi:hypothetical protein
MVPATVWTSEITMYKHPQCGCCEKWADILRDQGHQVTSKGTYNIEQLKNQLGLPSSLRSCHTAITEDFIIEGHVPEGTLARFLADPPIGAQGLAVPGMPIGSPGMEHPTRKDEYDVLWFDQQGKAQVFEHID